MTEHQYEYFTARSIAANERAMRHGVAVYSPAYFRIEEMCERRRMRRQRRRFMRHGYTLDQWIWGVGAC